MGSREKPVVMVFFVIFHVCGSNPTSLPSFSTYVLKKKQLAIIYEFFIAIYIYIYMLRAL